MTNIVTDKYQIEKTIYEKPHLTEGSKQWGYWWDPNLMIFVEQIRKKVIRRWAERYLRDKEILILGAGFSDVEFCREYSAHITAVDISDLQIERIRQKYPDVKGICANIVDLVPPGRYEALYCSSILHHLTDNFDQTLKSLASWLTDDGIVFIQAEPLRLNPMLWIGRKFFPSQYHTPNEKPFVLMSFKKQVGRYFTVVAQRCDYFLTMGYMVATRITRLTSLAWFKKMSFSVLTFLSVVDRSLSFPPFNEFYWLFGMVLKKK